MQIQEKGEKVYESDARIKEMETGKVEKDSAGEAPKAEKDYAICRGIHAGRERLCR